VLFNFKNTHFNQTEWNKKNSKGGIVNPAACWIRPHCVSQTGRLTNEAFEAAASSAKELKETKEFSLEKS